jgi:hypothetical protein
MTRLETQPSQFGLEGKDWARKRLEIQAELMKRMGVSVETGGDENNKEVMQWVESYAGRFAEITDNDLGLRQRLMSDQATVRESALEEIIAALKRKE